MQGADTVQKEEKESGDKKKEKGFTPPI